MDPDDFSLPEHHRDLERHFLALAHRFAGADRLEIRCLWTFFERELNDHFELEEKQLIPQFRHSHPTAAVEILRQHREIRSALASLGIQLDLHALAPELVEAFVQRLRAHALYEEVVFYPWTHDEGPVDRWLPIGRRLGALSRTIAIAFDLGEPTAGRGD